MRPLSFQGISSCRIASIPVAVALLIQAAPALADDANWDLQSVKVINLGLASPPMDFTMSGLSFAPVAVGVPLLVAIRGTPAAYQTAGTVFVAELTGIAASEGLKRLFNRPRPYLEDPTIRLPAGPEPSASMPSGHATLAFAGATALALDDPTLAIPAYAFASAVGFSRVYLGVHHPTDILAGALLGTGIGFGTYFLRQELVRQQVLPVIR